MARLIGKSWRSNTLTVWPTLWRKPFYTQFHESSCCKFYDWWVFRIKIWKPAQPKGGGE